MSALDLHPEELLDRDRRGALSLADRRELAAHLAVCDACRFEREVIGDFADEIKPRDGDALGIAKILATIPLAAPPPMTVVPILAVAKPRAAPRRLGRASFVAVLLVAAAGAAAGSHGAGTLRTKTDAASQSTAQAMTSVPVRSPAIEAPAETETAAPTDAPPDATAAPTAEPGAKPEPRAASAKPADVATTTPDALFREANQARRDGRTNDAVRLYRELQRRFPASGEAAASRLSLARLMLDRQKDSEGALGMFDGYLSAQPHGTLSEEALLGRALALQKLGRAAEERAAWQALIAKYPSSVHVGRARERLQALR